MTFIFVVFDSPYRTEENFQKKDLIRKKQAQKKENKQMKVIILTDPKKEISMKKNQLEYEIEKLYLDISLYSLTPEDLDLENWELNDSEIEDIKNQIWNDRKKFVDKKYKEIRNLEKQIEELEGRN